mmetsp:Transcript_56360/g.119939  ORF Transcript_56360/g.119939 Transcript_56360/m.119939 type:complete len:406 (+) Transcript_56360:277-1494(+)
MGDDIGMAVPPVSGLGNYKGVMLCNRPSDGPSRGGGGSGPAPFKSMVSPMQDEPLGLPPCRSADGKPSGVKKRGPSAALRQHVRWLRELQDQMRGEQEQVEREEADEEEKKRRLRNAAEKHREGVRAMLAERSEAVQTGHATATAPPLAAAAAAAAKATGGGGGYPKEDATKKKKVIKPLWALTEQEKEDFEDEEAGDLIDFAENLNFEKYLGDLEFKSSLAALKDRAGKISKEQDAFKESLLRDFNAALEEDATTSAGSPRSSVRLEDGIDGQSVLGDLRSEYSACSSRRPRGESKQHQKERDWDSSTNCGDGPQVDHQLKSAAAAVLESAPQIKAIHSKGSISKIIEKARAQDWEDNPGLVEMMRREGATPAPVITASEDMQQRLFKPVDPSNLPYLYRSPAI